MLKIIFLIITMFFLGGCASPYPMGIDKATWNELSSQAHAELFKSDATQRNKQDALREKHHHTEVMRELTIKATQEKRLNDLYSHAIYGDIIRVNISGGCGRIYKKCEPYRPISLILARGETKRISLIMKYNKLNLWVRYNDQGVNVSSVQNLDSFYSAVFLPQRWRHGKSFPFNLSSPYYKNPVIHSANIFIRYFPMNHIMPNFH